MENGMKGKKLVIASASGSHALEFTEDRKYLLMATCGAKYYYKECYTALSLLFI